MSRRKLFGAAGVTAAVVGAAGAGALAGRASAASTTFGGLDQPVPFRGERQAGIVTPQQDRMHFCAFDVTTDNRDEVVALLKQWTAMAERMTQGEDAVPNGAIGGNPYAPPDDTGEALGLPASGLTLTIGFGPSFFEKDGKDRFGIADERPAALADLPKFTNEIMDPAKCGGDICIQACAHDPQVAVHAVRNLARIGFGAVSVRWSQLGFGRTSSTSRTQATPRNLFGFKDGTANVKAEDTAAVRQHVWVAPGDGPEWMSGGSYLVTRKVRMTIETWDRTPLNEQESIIGRAKGTGAALGRRAEFDEPDFAAVGADGLPAIPVDSHVRLAHPDFNGGAKLLRRGYNYVDGSDGLGRLGAGLFFMAYQRDPRRQFVPIQSQLARLDKMNEYVRHISSGLFACPPGVRAADDYWGKALFSA
jgi:deferrochelatase/peroxidase EfeB